MEQVFFLKGIMIGFVIAAPVGPVGALCARRTLLHGRRAGFFSGMARPRPTLCTALLQPSPHLHIRPAGRSSDTAPAGWRGHPGVPGSEGLCCAAGEKVRTSRSARHYAGMYSSTFFLTLTNPMTIFSFAAVFAGFGWRG